MAVLFGSPVRKPVHPKEWIRPAGNMDFRVTQRFGDRDLYWNDGRAHGAVDLGDGLCGSIVQAMAEGYATAITDFSSPPAQGVRVTHAEGYVTEYWHLAGDAVELPGMPVQRGSLVGWVGDTGLDIGGCHLHIQMYRDGNLMNPEGFVFVQMAPGSLPMFDDIKGSAHQGDILAAYDRGIMAGVKSPILDSKGNVIKPGKFAPKGTVTREQLASVAVRLDNRWR